MASLLFSIFDSIAERPEIMCRDALVSVANRLKHAIIDASSQRQDSDFLTDEGGKRLCKIRASCRVLIRPVVSGEFESI